MNERPTITRQPASYQDVLDAPETMVADERRVPPFDAVPIDLTGLWAGEPET